MQKTYLQKLTEAEEAIRHHKNAIVELENEQANAERQKRPELAASFDPKIDIHQAQVTELESLQQKILGLMGYRPIEDQNPVSASKIAVDAITTERISPKAALPPKRVNKGTIHQLDEILDAYAEGSITHKEAKKLFRAFTAPYGEAHIDAIELPLADGKTVPLAAVIEQMEGTEETEETAIVPIEKVTPSWDQHSEDYEEREGFVPRDWMVGDRAFHRVDEMQAAFIVIDVKEGLNGVDIIARNADLKTFSFRPYELDVEPYALSDITGIKDDDEDGKEEAWSE